MRLSSVVVSFRFARLFISELEREILQFPQSASEVFQYQWRRGLLKVPLFPVDFRYAIFLFDLVLCMHCGSNTRITGDGSPERIHLRALTTSDTHDINQHDNSH